MKILLVVLIAVVLGLGLVVGNAAKQAVNKVNTSLVQSANQY